MRDLGTNGRDVEVGQRLAGLPAFAMPSSIGFGHQVGALPGDMKIGRYAVGDLARQCAARPGVIEAV